MRRTSKIILLIIGSLLSVNAIAYGAVSNFTFGIAAEFLAGVILFFAGIYFDSIVVSSGVFRWIWNIIAAGFVLSLCLSVFLAVYGMNDTADYSEDALIIPGAGLHGDMVSLPLKYRLDMAILYHEKNKDAIIVVTGGKGPGETVTEGYAMKNYLVNAGIPKDSILEENLSTSTYENFLGAKEILDKKLNENYSVVFVTNSFHIYRASKIAKTVGLSPNHIGAQIQWYSIPANYLRECAAVIKYCFLKR